MKTIIFFMLILATFIFTGCNQSQSENPSEASEQKSLAITESEAWKVVENNEYSAPDNWCGSGLYFHIKDGVPSCTYMIYGSGLPVISHFTSEVQIDSEENLIIQVPVNVSSTLNSEAIQVFDATLVLSDSEIHWGDRIFTKNSDAHSYDYVKSTPSSPVEVIPADLVIHFNDPNLEAGIRTALNKPEGDILDTDALSLTTLDLSQRVPQAFDSMIFDTSHRITDLDGLQYFTNLKVLKLSGNSITDISALSSLTNLVELNLSCNQITDLSPLQGLQNLRILSVAWNGIADYSSVYKLLSLEELYLNETNLLIPMEYAPNQLESLESISHLVNLNVLNIENLSITDISPLSELTKLKSLYARANLIQDIEPLQGLIELETLQLNSNKIEDIRPLESLSQLETLWIRDNLITNYDVLLELPNLKMVEK